jgi:hypothetical protein
MGITACRFFIVVSSSNLGRRKKCGLKGNGEEKDDSRFFNKKMIHIHQKGTFCK